MKNIVVRFCGDSGDGMQLTGNMFAQMAAELGHEISTLPDFPAEIRAPQGTLGGVSGFQVELGSEVYTPGDKADVIVAMNAAALKVCTLGKVPRTTRRMRCSRVTRWLSWIPIR